MYYLQRISTPSSESWLFLTYAILIAMAYIATKISPGTIAISFRTLYTSKDRDSIFYVGNADIRSQVLIFIFCIGILALNLQIALFNQQQFLFTNFLIAVTIITLMFVAKYLLTRLIFYTFYDYATFKIALPHYQRLIIATTTILTPITIYAVYAVQTQLTILNITYFAVGIFYFATLLFKIFKLFFNKLLDCFYILLYLCILEFLPLVCVIHIAQRII